MGLLTGLSGLGRESLRPGLTMDDIHVFFSSVPTTQRCLSRRLSWHKITVMPST